MLSCCVCWAQSMNGSIRESKSKEELDEFFEKMATPFKRPGTAPNQRSNDGTLRSHWAWEDHAPPTTWGQLAAQVRCRLSSPLHSACLCPWPGASLSRAHLTRAAWRWLQVYGPHHTVV